MFSTLNPGLITSNGLHNKRVMLRFDKSNFDTNFILNSRSAVY